jgi:myb proto-oncogene protein
MPRLLERVHATSNSSDGAVVPPSSSSALPITADGYCWPVDDVFDLDLGAAADMELSCTTAVSSSPSMSADGGVQLVSPPAPMVAAAESAPGCDDGSSSNSSTCAAMLDTAVWQPTQAHGGLMSQLFSAATCWSDQSSFHAELYADVGLPDLEFGGETMWGACADDLWYTQMLGL